MVSRLLICCEMPSPGKCSGQTWELPMYKVQTTRLSCWLGLCPVLLSSGDGEKNKCTIIKCKLWKCWEKTKRKEHSLIQPLGGDNCQVFTHHVRHSQVTIGKYDGVWRVGNRQKKRTGGTYCSWDDNQKWIYSDSFSLLQREKKN